MAAILKNHESVNLVFSWHMLWCTFI